MREKEVDLGEFPPERALVLRLWPAAQVSGKTEWRISVQDVETQDRRGFVSLDDFFLFMEELCGTMRK